MENTSPVEFRHSVRSGKWEGSTANCCSGFVQANLVIVPEYLADEFREFCRMNPKPCPLLEVTEPGKFDGLSPASNADLRTDISKYSVYRRGELVCEMSDLVDLRREDLERWADRA